MKVAGIANAHASAGGGMNGACVCMVCHSTAGLKGGMLAHAGLRTKAAQVARVNRGHSNAAVGMVEGHLHMSHIKWSGPRVSLLVLLCWGTLPQVTNQGCLRPPKRHALWRQA